ncbi:hypothetical protein EJB05_14473 [Eragrostis curvula]|uniref:Epidermal patterning factor-like protein n=1 Tax=Eragrostis curvula TaxID=38414 RepID=A0A5J9VZE4_9POAL|nr:hypothetical protein EJB05_14463 [Eragrostis curvula]TVU40986.1 hypothetical protein EJB05_14473 [Eragrostis curvula]
MVHLLQCSSAHMPLGPLFFSVLLLLTSSMETTFSEARRLPLRRLLETDTTTKEQEAAETMEAKPEGRALIGSRPPRCERVCMSCGHCEAVQVPIVPQVEHHKRAHQEQVLGADAVGAAMFSYRVNGITNYKPLSWKCRCGGAILDP